MGLFVLGDRRARLASRAGDIDLDNLPVELALFRGGLRLLVTPNGVVVLLLAADLVIAGALLALQTHALAIAVCIRKAVALAAVDERERAVLSARAGIGQVVWHVGHGLGPAGDDDGGLAGLDLRRGEHDGLHARGAHFVDRRGRDGGEEGGVQRALASGVLAETVERQKEGIVSAN